MCGIPCLCSVQPKFRQISFVPAVASRAFSVAGMDDGTKVGGQPGVGTHGVYRPSVRPRNIVMPVDIHQLHSHRNLRPYEAKALQQVQKQQELENTRGIRLGVVPEERTVGDVFMMVTDLCEQRHWLPNRNPTDSTSTDLLHRARQYAVPAGCETGLEKDKSRAWWGVLSRTPLSAPIHGPLAAVGRATADRMLTHVVATVYPRLRHHHHDTLRSTLCRGLLPTSRIATALGLSAVCNCDTDVALWGELNVLRQRLHVAQRTLSIHQSRAQTDSNSLHQAASTVAGGVLHHRLWYWERQITHIQRRLREFPADEHQLRPRLEWLNGLVFCFVGWIVVSQKREVAENFIAKLFFPDLYSLYLNRKAQLYRPHAMELRFAKRDQSRAATSGTDGALPSRDRETLRQTERWRHVPSYVVQAVLQPTPFSMGATVDFNDNKEHNDQVGIQIKLNYPNGKSSDALTEVVGPTHAIREMQLILRHDPLVPPAVRRRPFDFDVIYRTVPIVPTNEHWDHQRAEEAQHWDGPQSLVCRMVLVKDEALPESKDTYGDHTAQVLGEAAGATAEEAACRAAGDALLRYYLGPPAVESDPESLTQ